MATLPSPTQVAGDHLPLYSALYENVRKPDGNIPAGDAAMLLKKSGLPDAVLSKIWDMADTNAKGYLNKQGFFVALKLVSLAQMGLNLDSTLLCNDVAPPKLGNNPIAVPALAPKAIDWTISPAKLAEYEQLFDSLQPNNGYIPGNKVKSLLMDSKLPVDTLCKIWDLADMDQDGSLNRAEFAIAMHLVYKALEKYIIPNTLPAELIPSKLGIGVKNDKPAAVNGEVQTPWIVTAEEKKQYDALFKLTDVDQDGFVSGNEIKSVFLQSGVAQPVLANIWALCDIKQCGKLNAEQFALAMWLIKRKLNGIEPPAALSADMVPPSFRTGQAEVRTENPEIEAANKEIEELKREKRILEGEVLQKEADVKVKAGEANSLRGELDTLAATLRQLDGQKGEAQRRLDDLKAHVAKLEQQAEQQGSLVASQEQEIAGKKQQLQQLKEEEQQLEKTNKTLESDAESLNNQLQQSQLDISHLRGLMDQLIDLQTRLSEADRVLESCLSGGDALAVSHLYLQIEPTYNDEPFRKILNGGVEEPISAKTVNNIPPTNDFYSSNGFNDPFTSNDGFAAAFGGSSNAAFGGADAFGGTAFSGNDAFSTGSNAAFGGSNNSAFSSSAPASDPFGGGGGADGSEEGSDPFGCEPFAAPALPPKNKKPPPRPAPPRPQPPKSPIPKVADPPTQGQQQSGDSFADFNAFFPKSESQSKLEFTEDPFNNYRYEDPFGAEDPFKENHVDDPFAKK